MKSDYRLQIADDRAQTRKNYIVCFLSSVFCLLLFLAVIIMAGSGYGICLNDLLSQPEKYDHQEVEVSGELIGFPIPGERGDG